MFKCFSQGLILSLLALTAVSSAHIPDLNTQDLICAPQDPTDCYPVQFEPGKDWKPIREGQQIPQGLDVRLDWQTGEKFAKLADSTKQQYTKDIVAKPVEETDSDKIVNYSEEDIEEDNDITKLKMAYQGSNALVDLDDALEYLVSPKGKYDNGKLIESLESLTEHSHSLKDGILITESLNFKALEEIATSVKSSTQLKELTLRVIAQALRHNNKALDNINVKELLPKLFSLLKTSDNSVIQKRTLGVISSLLQTQETVSIFTTLEGEQILLDVFDSLKEDSKVRALEILDDADNLRLQKRSENDPFDQSLFNTLQSALSKDELKDDHHLERIFDRLVELKKDNRSFKVSDDFLNWLSDKVETRKKVKRDDGIEDSLHDKLLESRHLVFGNPMAMRKALADEL